MMLPPVRDLLKASVEVRNFVGSNPPRIYRHGRAPQVIPTPYLVWFLVTGTPENNLSDLPPVDRMVIQVDCYHSTDSGIDAMAKAVRDAIEPVAHITGIPVDERDPETNRYRMALQFDWWYDR